MGRAGIAVVALVSFALGGCGGLSDEDRADLERLRSAEEEFGSLSELEVEVEASLKCLTFRGDLGSGGGADDRVAVESDCLDTPQPETVVVIGNRAYVRLEGTSPGRNRWLRAEIAPELAESLAKDPVEGYSDVLDQATELELSTDPADKDFAVDEGRGFRALDTYVVEMPSEALIEWAEAEELAEDLEGIEGEFKITLDEEGTLRVFEFEFAIDDGPTESVKATYLPLSRPIEAPPAAQVVGELQSIDSRAELRALYGEAFDSSPLTP